MLHIEPAPSRRCRRLHAHRARTRCLRRAA
jgi:hypothetical protein